MVLSLTVVAKVAVLCAVGHGMAVVDVWLLVLLSSSQFISGTSAVGCALLGVAVR